MSTLIENSNEVLNDLIQINNDRIEGYTKAIHESEKEATDLISKFERMIDQSREYADELKSMVNSNGGTIAAGTTALGKVYRVWMDLRHSISGDERENVLELCEFGEDAAQKAYKKALEETDLTEEARSLITTQKAELRNAHDMIKNLRDRAKEPAAH